MSEELKREPIKVNITPLDLRRIRVARFRRQSDQLARIARDVGDAARCVARWAVGTGNAKEWRRLADAMSELGLEAEKIAKEVEDDADVR